MENGILIEPGKAWRTKKLSKMSVFEGLGGLRTIKQMLVSEYYIGQLIVSFYYFPSQKKKSKCLYFSWFIRVTYTRTPLNHAFIFIYPRGVLTAHIIVLYDALNWLPLHSRDIFIGCSLFSNAFTLTLL